KTEVIQTALVGLVVLGDRVSLVGLCSLLLGLVGVLVLSDPPKPGQSGLLRRFGNRAALLGTASGAFFAISAVGYRGATLQVASDIPFLRAMLTVAAVTAAQSVFMALYLSWREPGELKRVWASRFTSVWMGLASLGGSVGWFTAFTLQNAAYVFAVGQVEVLFSMAASVLFFKEHITKRELLGIALVTGSILLLVSLG
ncbi:MAG: EamA family transporter, partial [Pseudomonadota bacterium]